MKIVEINIFPIKSLAGIALQRVFTEKTGLQNDRRMMLIDAQNRFVSLRDFPELWLFKPEFAEGGFLVKAHEEKIFVPECAGTGKFEQVKIWDDTVRAEVFDNEINGFFSDMFGNSLRLVKIAGERQIDVRYAREGDFTTFSDGYPVLVTSRKSLEYLNEKAGKSFDMLRFRPNIVIDGGSAFEEQSFEKISLLRNPDFSFRLVKPCARCVVTTIDPETAQKETEPLRTLAAINSLNSKIIFGMNAIPDFEGEIFVGDALEATKRQ
jgi:uncharacterized protein YcbX